jgi:hypothetical protein
MIDPQKAISELNQKLAALAEKEQLLRGELNAISYAAHIEHDTKAIKRVGEIADTLTTVGIEADSLKAAITEAERRAAAAREVASVQAQAKRAEKAN